MKIIHVTYDFVRFSPIEKIPFYRNVISRLTDNPYFITPDVSLIDANAAIDALEQAVIAASDGGRVAISLMHDQEKAVEVPFRHLAAYVERMAAGDETKILSSGFHHSRQPVIHPKAILAVYDGEHSGSVHLVAKAVPRARSYHFRMAIGGVPETDEGWILCGFSTRADFVLSGLDVMKKYVFCVAALTPDGMTDYSAPVEKIVI
jgi:quinolinate synthase